MFERDLMAILRQRAAQYPAIALLGPRQSGKSTLTKAAFPSYVYLSLEDRSVRERAALDPRGFFDIYRDAPGIILDEFQKQPELLSYIQLAIDERYRPGYFVLTGSHNFLMNEKIAQSLAGRVTILTLLPLSIAELQRNALIAGPAEKSMFSGGYPRIYDQQLSPVTWYNDYIETYVEKDIKHLSSIVDLELFRKFVALCAGRIGQTLDLTSLSNDSGISVPTVQRWLSLLQSSYILFLLQPYHTNFGKRLTKSPKLYFYDTGLACSLLGIESALQLHTHYLRGGLFESFIIADIAKQLYNTGQRPRLYFWQESGKTEIDCVIEKGASVLALEIKASKTITKDFFKPLHYFVELARAKESHNFIVYAGEDNEPWPGGTVLSWQKTASTLAPLLKPSE